MTKIILPGRTDVDEYFRLSGVFESEKLSHTPFLAFLGTQDALTVRIIEKPTELLSLPDETLVMGQWRGEWRSDFFQFTVGRYRQHYNARLEPLKAAKNVVKKVGPRGGFLHLSYEYLNDRGVVVHTSTGSKDEAERLEVFFRQHNISIITEKAK